MLVELCVGFGLQNGWKHGKVDTKSEHVVVQKLGSWIKHIKSRWFMEIIKKHLGIFVLNYCWHKFLKLNWYNYVFSKYLGVHEILFQIETFFEAPQYWCGENFTTISLVHEFVCHC